MYHLFRIFLLLLPLAAFSQINTEVYRKDYVNLGWILSLDATFEYSTGNTEELSSENILRIDHNGLKQDYFTVVEYEFKTANQEKTKNKAFIHFRYIRDISEWFFLEAFAQAQYDEFLLLNHRYLAGAGGRFDLASMLAPDRDKETRKFDAFYGLGAMWETEQYNLSDSDPVYNLVRLTSYLSMSYKPSETFRISVVSYYQPEIAEWADFRSRSNLELEIKILKKLYFISKYDLLYRSRPVGNTLRTDFEIKNGIRVRLP